MKPKISIVINTLNEERNLPYALRSVCAWADEIVVVDMHSDDRTVEIAKRYNATVYSHPRTPFFDAARRFAVEKATGDWILLLDADEIVPPSLSEVLVQAISKDHGDVYLIPRLNYLLGVSMKGSGWGAYEDHQLRLFRSGSVHLSERIHGFIRPTSEARVISMPYKNEIALHHFNYLDSAHFVEKMNRYTTVEARQALERGERVGRSKAMLYSVLTFVDRYIWKKGFLDGWRGFYLSGFMAVYRWLTYAKLQELRSGIDSDRVQQTYQEIAEKLVDAYPPCD